MGRVDPEAPASSESEELNIMAAVTAFVEKNINTTPMASGPDCGAQSGDSNSLEKHHDQENMAVAELDPAIEARKLLQVASEHAKRALDEHNKVDAELENKKARLESCRKELTQCELFINQNMQKIKKKKKKNHAFKSALLMAVEEQRKADEKVLKLVEELKREKEEAVGAKQKLEMEIAELKAKLGDDASMRNKIEELNADIQSARRELIEEFAKIDLSLCNKPLINIKTIGQIDFMPFRKACEERFSCGEVDFRALELCSLLQEKLKDSAWHPFKTITTNKSVVEKVLDDNDATLRWLKAEWGDDCYDSLTKALKEVEEYNPTGRYAILELWNTKEDRKATVREVITFIFKQLKKNNIPSKKGRLRLLPGVHGG